MSVDDFTPLPEPEHTGRDARSLAEVLGIEIRFAPEYLAPPVDCDRLRALVRRELSPEAQRETCRLVATFRSWYQTWVQVVAEDAARPRRGQ